MQNFKDFGDFTKRSNRLYIREVENETILTVKPEHPNEHESQTVTERTFSEDLLDDEFEFEVERENVYLLNARKQKSLLKLLVASSDFEHSSEKEKYTEKKCLPRYCIKKIYNKMSSRSADKGGNKISLERTQQEQSNIISPYICKFKLTNDQNIQVKLKLCQHRLSDLLKDPSLRIFRPIAGRNLMTILIKCKHIIENIPQYRKLQINVTDFLESLWNQFVESIEPITKRSIDLKGREISTESIHSLTTLSLVNTNELSTGLSSILKHASEPVGEEKLSLPRVNQKGRAPISAATRRRMEKSGKTSYFNLVPRSASLEPVKKVKYVVESFYPIRGNQLTHRKSSNPEISNVKGSISSQRSSMINRLPRAEKRMLNKTSYPTFVETRYSPNKKIKNYGRRSNTRNVYGYSLDKLPSTDKSDIFVYNSINPNSLKTDVVSHNRKVQPKLIEPESEISRRRSRMSSMVFHHLKEKRLSTSRRLSSRHNIRRDSNVFENRPTPTPTPPPLPPPPEILIKKISSNSLMDINDFEDEEELFHDPEEKEKDLKTYIRQHFNKYNKLKPNTYQYEKPKSKRFPLPNVLKRNRNRNLLSKIRIYRPKDDGIALAQNLFNSSTFKNKPVNSFGQGLINVPKITANAFENGAFTPKIEKTKTSGITKVIGTASKSKLQSKESDIKNDATDQHIALVRNGSYKSIKHHNLSQKNAPSPIHSYNPTRSHSHNKKRSNSSKRNRGHSHKRIHKLSKKSSHSYSQSGNKIHNHKHSDELSKRLLIDDDTIKTNTTVSKESDNTCKIFTVANFSLTDDADNIFVSQEIKDHIDNALPDVPSRSEFRKPSLHMNGMENEVTKALNIKVDHDEKKVSILKSEASYVSIGPMIRLSSKIHESEFTANVDLNDLPFHLHFDEKEVSEVLHSDELLDNDLENLGENYEATNVITEVPVIEKSSSLTTVYGSIKLPTQTDDDKQEMELVLVDKIPIADLKSTSDQPQNISTTTKLSCTEQKHQLGNMEQESLLSIETSVYNDIKPILKYKSKVKITRVKSNGDEKNIKMVPPVKVNKLNKVKNKKSANIIKENGPLISVQSLISIKRMKLFSRTSGLSHPSTISTEKIVSSVQVPYSFDTRETNKKLNEKLNNLIMKESDSEESIKFHCRVDKKFRGKQFPKNFVPRLNRKKLVKKVKVTSKSGATNRFIFLYPHQHHKMKPREKFELIFTKLFLRFPSELFNNLLKIASGAIYHLRIESKEKPIFQSPITPILKAQETVKPQKPLEVRKVSYIELIESKLKDKPDSSKNAKKISITGKGLKSVKNIGQTSKNGDKEPTSVDRKKEVIVKNKLSHAISDGRYGSTPNHDKKGSVLNVDKEGFVPNDGKKVSISNDGKKSLIDEVSQNKKTNGKELIKENDENSKSGIKSKFDIETPGINDVPQNKETDFSNVKSNSDKLVETNVTSQPGSVSGAKEKSNISIREKNKNTKSQYSDTADDLCFGNCINSKTSSENDNTLQTNARTQEGSIKNFTDDKSIGTKLSGIEKEKYISVNKKDIGKEKNVNQIVKTVSTSTLRKKESVEVQSINNKINQSKKIIQSKSIDSCEIIRTMSNCLDLETKHSSEPLTRIESAEGGSTINVEAQLPPHAKFEKIKSELYKHENPTDLGKLSISSANELKSVIFEKDLAKSIPQIKEINKTDHIKYKSVSNENILDNLGNKNKGIEKMEKMNKFNKDLLNDSGYHTKPSSQNIISEVNQQDISESKIKDNRNHVESDKIKNEIIEPINDISKDIENQRMKNSLKSETKHKLKSNKDNEFATEENNKLKKSVVVGDSITEEINKEYNNESIKLNYSAMKDDSCALVKNHDYDKDELENSLTETKSIHSSELVELDRTTVDNIGLALNTDVELSETNQTYLDLMTLSKSSVIEIDRKPNNVLKSDIINEDMNPRPKSEPNVESNKLSTRENQTKKYGKIENFEAKNDTFLDCKTSIDTLKDTNLKLSFIENTHRSVEKVVSVMNEDHPRTSFIQEPKLLSNIQLPTNENIHLEPISGSPKDSGFNKLSDLKSNGSVKIVQVETGQISAGETNLEPSQPGYGKTSESVKSVNLCKAIQNYQVAASQIQDEIPDLELTVHYQRDSESNKLLNAKRSDSVQNYQVEPSQIQEEQPKLEQTNSYQKVSRPKFILSPKSSGSSQNPKSEIQETQQITEYNDDKPVLIKQFNSTYISNDSPSKLNNQSSFNEITNIVNQVSINDESKKIVTLRKSASKCCSDNDNIDINPQPSKKFSFNSIQKNDEDAKVTFNPENDLDDLSNIKMNPNENELIQLIDEYTENFDNQKYEMNKNLSDNMKEMNDEIGIFEDNKIFEVDEQNDLNLIPNETSVESITRIKSQQSIVSEVIYKQDSNKQTTNDPNEKDVNLVKQSYSEEKVVISEKTVKSSSNIGNESLEPSRKSDQMFDHTRSIQSTEDNIQKENILSPIRNDDNLEDMKFSGSKNGVLNQNVIRKSEPQNKLPNNGDIEIIFNAAVDKLENVFASDYILNLLDLLSLPYVNILTNCELGLFKDTLNEICGFQDFEDNAENSEKGSESSRIFQEVKSTDSFIIEEEDPDIIKSKYKLESNELQENFESVEPLELDTNKKKCKTKFEKDQTYSLSINPLKGFLCTETSEICVKKEVESIREIEDLETNTNEIETIDNDDKVIATMTNTDVKSIESQKIGDDSKLLEKEMVQTDTTNEGYSELKEVADEHVSIVQPKTVSFDDAYKIIDIPDFMIQSNSKKPEKQKVGTKPEPISTKAKPKHLDVRVKTKRAMKTSLKNVIKEYKSRIKNNPKCRKKQPVSDIKKFEKRANSYNILGTRTVNKEKLKSNKFLCSGVKRRVPLNFEISKPKCTTTPIICEYKNTENLFCLSKKPTNRHYNCEKSIHSLSKETGYLSTKYLISNKFEEKSQNECRIVTPPTQTCKSLTRSDINNMRYHQNYLSNSPECTKCTNASLNYLCSYNKILGINSLCNISSNLSADTLPPSSTLANCISVNSKRNRGCSDNYTISLPQSLAPSATPSTYSIPNCNYYLPSQSSNWNEPFFLQK